MSSLIPNGETGYPLVSGKASTIKQVIYSVDATAETPVYDSIDFSHDSVNNSFATTDATVTAFPAGCFALVSSVDKCVTLTQSDPIEVVDVGTHILASNSNSIYKGNALVDGKIQVGTGVGLESKVVEDAVFEWDYIIDKVGITVTLEKDKTYLILTDGYDFIDYGHISKRVGDTATLTTTPGTFNPASDVYDTVGISTTPQHSTISLDNTSDGHKHLPVLCTKDNRLYIGTVSAEVKPGGDTGQFDMLTNGTTTDWNGETIKYSFNVKPLPYFKGDE